MPRGAARPAPLCVTAGLRGFGVPRPCSTSPSNRTTKTTLPAPTRAQRRARPLRHVGGGGPAIRLGEASVPQSNAPSLVSSTRVAAGHQGPGHARSGAEQAQLRRGFRLPVRVPGPEPVASGKWAEACRGPCLGVPPEPEPGPGPQGQGAALGALGSLRQTLAAPPGPSSVLSGPKPRAHPTSHQRRHGPGPKARHTPFPPPAPPRPGPQVSRDFCPSVSPGPGVPRRPERARRPAPGTQGTHGRRGWRSRRSRPSVSPPRSRSLARLGSKQPRMETRGVFAAEAPLSRARRTRA